VRGAVGGRILSSAGVVYHEKTLKREYAELFVRDADEIPIELIDVCEPSDKFKNKRLITTNVFVRAKNPYQHQLLATRLAASTLRGERLRVHVSSNPIFGDNNSISIARKQITYDKPSQNDDSRRNTRYRQEREERDEQRRQIAEQNERIAYEWGLLQRREDEIDDKERRIQRNVDQLENKLIDLNEKIREVKKRRISILSEMDSSAKKQLTVATTRAETAQAELVQAMSEALITEAVAGGGRARASAKRARTESVVLIEEEDGYQGVVVAR
jgi:hypothetical protein